MPCTALDRELSTINRSGVGGGGLEFNPGKIILGLLTETGEVRG